MTTISLSEISFLNIAKKMAKTKKTKSDTAESVSDKPQPQPESSQPEAVPPETHQQKPPARSKIEKPALPQPGQDFESYYLQRVTAEFADDIDKVRNAGDFKSSSIPVLVRALKQGAGGFSEEERRRIMNPRS